MKGDSTEQQSLLKNPWRFFLPEVLPDSFSTFYTARKRPTKPISVEKTFEREEAYKQYLSEVSSAVINVDELEHLRDKNKEKTKKPKKDKEPSAKARSNNLHLPTSLQKSASSALNSPQFSSEEKQSLSSLHTLQAHSEPEKPSPGPYLAKSVSGKSSLPSSQQPLPSKAPQSIAIHEEEAFLEWLEGKCQLLHKKLFSSNYSSPTLGLVYSILSGYEKKRQTINKNPLALFHQHQHEVLKKVAQRSKTEDLTDDFLSQYVFSFLRVESDGVLRDELIKSLYQQKRKEGKSLPLELLLVDLSLRKTKESRNERVRDLLKFALQHYNDWDLSQKALHVYFYALECQAESGLLDRVMMELQFVLGCVIREESVETSLMKRRPQWGTWEALKEALAQDSVIDEGQISGNQSHSKELTSASNASKMSTHLLKIYSDDTQSPWPGLSGLLKSLVHTMEKEEPMLLIDESNKSKGMSLEAVQEILNASVEGADWDFEEYMDMEMTLEKTLSFQLTENRSFGGIESDDEDCAVMSSIQSMKQGLSMASSIVSLMLKSPLKNTFRMQFLSRYQQFESNYCSESHRRKQIVTEQLYAFNSLLSMVPIQANASNVNGILEKKRDRQSTTIELWATENAHIMWWQERLQGKNWVKSEDKVLDSILNTQHMENNLARSFSQMKNTTAMVGVLSGMLNQSSPMFAAVLEDSFCYSAMQELSASDMKALLKRNDSSASFWITYANKFVKQGESQKSVNQRSSDAHQLLLRVAQVAFSTNLSFAVGWALSEMQWRKTTTGVLTLSGLGVKLLLCALGLMPWGEALQTHSSPSPSCALCQEHCLLYSNRQNLKNAIQLLHAQLQEWDHGKPCSWAVDSSHIDCLYFDEYMSRLLALFVLEFFFQLHLSPKEMMRSNASHVNKYGDQEEDISSSDSLLSISSFMAFLPPKIIRATSPTAGIFEADGVNESLYQSNIERSKQLRLIMTFVFSLLEGHKYSSDITLAILRTFLFFYPEDSFALRQLSYTYMRLGRKEDCVEELYALAHKRISPLLSLPHERWEDYLLKENEFLQCELEWVVSFRDIFLCNVESEQNLTSFLNTSPIRQQIERHQEPFIVTAIKLLSKHQGEGNMNYSAFLELLIVRMCCSPSPQNIILLFKEFTEKIGNIESQNLWYPYLAFLHVCSKAEALDVEASMVTKSKIDELDIKRIADATEKVIAQETENSKQHRMREDQVKPRDGKKSQREWKSHQKTETELDDTELLYGKMLKATDGITLYQERLKKKREANSLQELFQSVLLQASVAYPYHKRLFLLRLHSHLLNDRLLQSERDDFIVNEIEEAQENKIRLRMDPLRFLE